MDRPVSRLALTLKSSFSLARLLFNGLLAAPPKFWIVVEALFQSDDSGYECLFRMAREVTTCRI